LDLPAGFEDALMGALQKDPAARHKDIAQFAAGLAPFGSPQATASALRAARVLKVTPGAASDLAVARSANVAIREPTTHDALLAGTQPHVLRSRGGAWAVGTSMAILGLVALGAGGAWCVQHRTTATAVRATVATPSTSVAPAVVPAPSVETADAPSAIPTASLGPASLGASASAPPAQKTFSRPATTLAPRAPPQPPRRTTPFEDR
jgi:hypothetical protein